MSALVTAAYPERLAGRLRFVVVVRSGAVVRFTDTRQLSEAWRVVEQYPHHPDLVVRLPPKGRS